VADADRWLLNHLNTFELGLLIVGGGIFFAVIGLLLVRRFVPPEVQIDNNEVGGVLLGLLGAFYGIVLGFAIVVLFEDFRSADESVKDETTALARLYRSTDLFPSQDRQNVGRAIAQYRDAVRDLEWPLMRTGGESLRAHNKFGELYTQIEDVTPRTHDQEVFYDEAVQSLTELVSARRTRLNAATEVLPTPFQVLLLGGAGVVLLFLYFFGMKNVWAHVAMVAGVAGVLAFSLLLVLLLAFPFSGDVTVSNAPFKLGIVGQLSPVTGTPAPGCEGCSGPP